MIVSCPKCGFTQPKDKYCAKCGVDMDAYRPQQPPLSTRVLKSWVFQSLILIVAIGTALSFLKLQRDREILRDNQLAEFTKPPPLPGGQAALEAPAPPPLPTTPAQARATPTTALATATQTAARQNSRTAPAAAAAVGAQNPATSSPRGGEGNRDAVFTQIDLVFAEVPRTVLSNLEAGSRMLEADAIGAGVYPKIAPLMRQLTQAGPQRVRSLRVLDSARNLAVKINQPIVTFKGMRDPQIDRNIGLTSTITPTMMDENGIHIQVDVHRLLRDSTAASGRFEDSYSSEMVISKGAGAFIAGLIPHRPVDQSERGVYANASVLKVLTSQDFQDDLSEFVLLIEPR